MTERPHRLGRLMWALIVLCALAHCCAPASATVVWSNGCDSTTGWTLYTAGTTTWPTLVTSNVHSGTGAWKVNNPLNRIYQTFSATSGPVAFRLWLYDPTGSGYFTNAVTYDIRTSQSAATSLLGIGLASSVDYSKYDFRILGGGGPSWVAGSVSRSVGWHRMEMYYSGSGNSVTGYVDGTQAISYNGLTAALTFGCVIVGCGTGNADVSAYENRCDTMAVLGSPTRVTFAKSGSGTITTTLGATLLTQQNGYYDTGETVALTATPGAGYQFVNWTSTGGWSSFSANVDYAPEAGNPTVTANFVPAGHQVTTTVCTDGSCAVTGAGWYDAGDPVTVTASVNPGFIWQYWTDDSCSGTHAVATDTTYSFTMPGSSVNLYAQCSAIIYNLSRSTCGGGTVSGSSGQFATGASVTITANPDAGYEFLGWSADACGSLSYISVSPSHTFDMPPNDVTLYANFGVLDPADGLFVETFESYATGGTSFDSIDKNDPVGPNQAANGSGNPWWGSLAPNGRVNTSLAHWGSKSLWGTAGGGKDLVNLQYRANGGAAITGSIYLDWWFYDPFGPNYVGGVRPDFCGDYAALSCYTGIPTDTDYPSPVPYPLTGSVQQLAVGMSDDLASGYDGTKYQVRIAGDAGGYNNGWFNTPANRSVGWHHARVVIGPRKPSNTNDVAFYIDNMGCPVVGPRDSVTTNNNFSIAEVNTIMPVAGSCDSVSGCLYSKNLHFSNVDDICFGAVPVAAAAAPTGPVETSQITWNWSDLSGNDDGFNLWDAEYGGVFKGLDASPATSFTEGGLLANTNYARWVCPFITQYAGNVEGPRILLPAVYTLALPPVYGNSGDAAISCSNGQGNNTTPYPGGTATTFTALNGFGTGPARASKYLCVWDKSVEGPVSWAEASEWTSGTHTEAPSASGSYYMHLRSCNGDGVANTTTLTLGPYNYQAGSPVGRISELWGLPNGQEYVLSSKVVSAVWSDGFWMEETDRSAGIKVVWTGTPVVGAGDLVDVAGVLSTENERLLTSSADGVHKIGPAPHPIQPVAVVEQYIGGEEVNYDTPAVFNGLGLYSVGLLVRLAGTAGNAGAGFFYLDDGSRLTDGAIKGIKVVCGSLTPATSGPQVVTGVVGIISGKPVIYAVNIQAL